MGFAEDKVYEYIRENMHDFHRIRVRQLIHHLPCLSDADREEIEAHDDRKGNEHAVWQLFYYLKCRNGWVKELIEALRKNRHYDLADRVQCKYDAHQVGPRNKASLPAVNNSLPSCKSVCSRMPPPAANPDPQRAGPTFENNPHTPSLPRQPASLPGPDTPLLLQTNPSGVESYQDLGEYNTPVQEMEPVAKQKVAEDALTPWREAPSPQPTGNAALADLRASQEGSNHGDGLSSAAVQLPPGSPVGHLLGCGGVPRGEVEVAQPGRPVFDPSGQGQDWAGRQQHPVCVNDGYFGNMNHLNIGNSRKASMPGEPVQRGEPAAAPSPEDFKNQPEEVYYSSFERSPLAASANRAVPGHGQQAGDSLREQKIQALQGYENGNLTSSMVDVHNPVLLQTQFDAEQKRAQGQREDHGGERDAFPLHQIRDSAQSTHSYDPQSKVQILASAAHMLRPASTPGPSNVLPTSSPLHPSTTSIERVLKLSNAKPAVEFPDPSGFSSTAVIPPSSPALPSDPSEPAFNIDLDELKSPVQECKLPTRDTDSSSTSKPKENANQAPKPPAPSVTQTSPGFPGSTVRTTAREAGWKIQNALPGSPGGCQVFCSEPDEEVELSKPGVLTSTGGVEEPAQRQPESPETNVQYSGRSNRFFLSSECSLGSNPLMISESSSACPSSSRAQRNQPEENHYSSQSDHPLPSWATSNGPRRVEATKTSRASLLPESSSTWDSTAVGTHEVHVVEYPGADLGEAPSLRDVASVYENPSPASSGWDSAAVGTHEVHVVEYPGADLGEAPSLRDVASVYENPSPASSGSNIKRPKRDSDGTSFPLKDYILPAAIAAFTSVVAFLFYKHLRN
ncbi:mitochondrial antiviral-signaling protein isoform X3 [Chelonia mydas]|uniref:mitochondrial antiviral-signaling protein isoform X3 n=1 Tax=Chelonia mydas TaxID=8469 RepID=UPI0018A22BF0|nr:mitochondrial antiviral-signaling protein isoform X3 [Chelonia mydas]